MKEERITVNCYSGYKLNEKPQKFTHLNKEYLIKSIQSISLVESTHRDGRYLEYKVTVEDCQSYSLRYYPHDESWWLLV